MSISKYPIITYKDEDGVFIAESPLLPGFHTYGATEQELLQNIEEALSLYLEALQNKEIPMKKMDFVSLSFIEPKNLHVRTHH